MTSHRVFTIRVYLFWRLICAGGYIGDRFLTGLRPQEYFFHCMSGREGACTLLMMMMMMMMMRQRLSVKSST